MSDGGLLSGLTRLLRRHPSSPDEEEAEPDPSSVPRTPVLGTWLRWSPAISLAAILAFAYATRAADSPFLSILAVAVIAGAAASLVGALVGFLFGLPRTREPTATPGESQIGMATNTNLEEISDWLTKILVGLGLVQLGAFTRHVGDAADSVARGLGGGDAAETFAVGLIVYSLVDGFLLGYLWTRIVVSYRLREAQEAMLARGALLALPPPMPPPAAPPAPPGAPTPPPPQDDVEPAPDAVEPPPPEDEPPPPEDEPPPPEDEPPPPPEDEPPPPPEDEPPPRPNTQPAKPPE
jgi:hypothetical protein